MRGRALPFVMIALLSGTADAQIIWQPSPSPLVTAEHETWYMAGDPISFNGALYYPAGAPEAFNAVQMVRSGSYRGIPLYTDTTLQPYSIVFVPIAGNRVQPYELPRTGALAASVGSRTPSFPIETAAEALAAGQGNVPQAAGPPTYAPGYEVATAPEAASVAQAPAAIGTAGRTPPAPVYVPRPANSIVTTTNQPDGQARAPKGVSGAWLDYDGRHWVAIGKGVYVTPDLHRVGTYHKFPVYARGDDRSTIYIPSAPGVVVPFQSK